MKSHRGVARGMGVSVVLAGMVCSGVALGTTSASATTVDAICTVTTVDSISPALDPGQSDTAEAVTDTGTENYTCLDYSGKNLLVTGTGTAKVQLPGAQCTGDENEGTNDVTVTWSDGTTSHIHYDKIHGVETAGLVAVSESGTVSPTSTKFANDTSSLTGELIGRGCGTATGETSGQGIFTVVFSH
ncbi:hypothetical protein [Streptomyces mirabilis]|uniref:hypothetical protein n=1 Tax=Streptomyces mirabilis TaxID=68239 RepID=UPI0036D98E92